MTAVYIRGAGNVVLDNVVIRGVDRGIVLEDSQAILNRVLVVESGIGLLAKNSHAIVNRSIFLSNVIDILAENASLDLIDTFAQKLIAYLSSVRWVHHYAIDPYRIIAQARELLKERNPVTKRRKFRQLVKTVFRYAERSITLYNILKIVLKLLGIDLP